MKRRGQMSLSTIPTTGNAGYRRWNTVALWVSLFRTSRPRTSRLVFHLVIALARCPSRFRLCCEVRPYLIGFARTASQGAEAPPDALSTHVHSPAPAALSLDRRPRSRPDVHGQLRPSPSPLLIGLRSKIRTAFPHDDIFGKQRWTLRV